MTSVPHHPIFAIQTSALAKSYGFGPTRTNALEPTSLTIPHGSIFALLGNNGAGKTTLIKLLVNILRPTAGQASVLNRLSTSIVADDFTSIGYVSENQELPGWMTVAGFLRYQSGFYPRWNDADLIRRFDLPLNRKLKHLSRGQRMKVALTSVLAFAPQLIILDEPFSGLDPQVRDELIEALLDAAALRNSTASPLTILLSSHDLYEIESFSTHVAFLRQGQLLFVEDMPSLYARFRDVTVTLASAPPPSPSSNYPPSWLRIQHSGHTLRFIHSHADSEPIEQQVREAFPDATAIDLQPINLRSIFLAIAYQDSATEGGRS